MLFPMSHTHISSQCTRSKKRPHSKQLNQPLLSGLIFAHENSEYWDRTIPTVIYSSLLVIRKEISSLGNSSFCANSCIGSSAAVKNCAHFRPFQHSSSETVCCFSAHSRVIPSVGLWLLEEKAFLYFCSLNQFVTWTSEMTRAINKQKHIPWVQRFRPSKLWATDPTEQGSAGMWSTGVYPCWMADGRALGCAFPCSHSL